MDLNREMNYFSKKLWKLYFVTDKSNPSLRLTYEHTDSDTQSQSQSDSRPNYSVV